MDATFCIKTFNALVYIPSTHFTVTILVVIIPIADLHNFMFKSKFPDGKMNGIACSLCS